MLLGNALSEPALVVLQSHLKAPSNGGDGPAREKVRRKL
jgi:hypothetical protein